jgi:hypothetical protein
MVWNFVVSNADVFISADMYARHMKATLHPDGMCQISGTSFWVTQALGRRNAERHFQRWYEPRPLGTEAQHVFRVVIPTSELRRVNDPGADLAGILWIPAAPPGSAVAFECYLTPPHVMEPTVIAGKLAGEHLCSIKIADDRWLVVLHRSGDCQEIQLPEIKRAMRDYIRQSNIVPPRERPVSCLLTAGRLHGLIEVIPPSGAAKHRA